MLDEGTSALLKCVNDGCKVGCYQIFTVEDFSAASTLPMDQERIEALLSCLQQEGYLTVKYAGGGMYCIGLLSQGEEYLGREQERVKQESVRLGLFTQNAFFGGLLGGVAGGFLSAAIALLVALITRR